MWTAGSPPSATALSHCTSSSHHTNTHRDHVLRLLTTILTKPLFPSCSSSSTFSFVSFHLYLSSVSFIGCITDWAVTSDWCTNLQPKMTVDPETKGWNWMWTWCMHCQVHFFSYAITVGKPPDQHIYKKTKVHLSGYHLFFTRRKIGWTWLWDCGLQETRAPHEAVLVFKILLTMWYQWLSTLCLSCYCSYLLVQKNMDVWVSCLSWRPQVLELKETEDISKRLTADHCNTPDDMD